jgi:hypothetical protein
MRPSLLSLLSLLTVSLLAACGVPDEGPWMAPGQDCTLCHTSSGNAPAFLAAGTVFQSTGTQGASGVRIRLVDANGTEATLQSNGAGNFYVSPHTFLRSALVEPLKDAVVEVTVGGQTVRRSMAARTPMPITGSCNSCHVDGGAAGGPLRTASP